MRHRIGVVIPARDEEQLIGRCLAAVVESARHVPVPVDITVVADGCLDRTAEIARSFRDVRVIELESSNVGTARAAGAGAALARGAHWLANTDADSVVPPHWLAHQYALGVEGWDVVVGTVRPDFAELEPEQRAAWLASHRAGEPNGHVHGANLGVRASAYVASGGYRSLPEHEDVDLVGRLSEFRSTASDGAEVITSARRFGRTPGGYARFLREELLPQAHLLPARQPD
ncbi:glycosyltransferase family A protein [soil metagenome]